jgi:hypothetical protein
MRAISRIISKLSLAGALVACCGTQCCPPPCNSGKVASNLVAPVEVAFSLNC